MLLFPAVQLCRLAATAVASRQAEPAALLPFDWALADATDTADAAATSHLQCDDSGISDDYVDVGGLQVSSIDERRFRKKGVETPA